MFTDSIIFSSIFVNDTATTEIYTYLHTLSLHDARPIYSRASSESMVYLNAGRTRRQWARSSSGSSDGSSGALSGWAEADASARYRTEDRRSEEHTSELQSLMRIPYAVF